MVMRLDLEFVPRPRRLPAATLFAAVAVAAAGVFLSQYWTVRSEIAEAEGNIARLGKLLNERQRQAAASSPRERELAAAAAAIHAKLRYPWNNVFSSLESVEMGDVSLLSMSHDQVSGRTVLQLEAVDARALNRFVSALNDELQPDEAWALAGYQLQPQSNRFLVKATVRSSALKAR
jgi:hypothetical protein